MGWMEWTLVVSLAASLILGLQIRRAAPAHLLNRAVFAVAAAIAGWLALNVLTLRVRAGEEARAEALIRAMSIAAALLPACFHSLRLVIARDPRTWAALGRASLPWFIAAGAVSLLCLTRAFLSGARLPDGGPDSPGVAEPVYGWAVVLYALYFVVTIGALFRLAAREAPRLDAARRLEMGFLRTAMVGSMIVGVLVGLTGGLVTGRPEFAPVANAASVAVMMGVLAYGMATRRILNQGEFLARTSAWVLTLVAACALFTGAWHLFTATGASGFGAGLLAALAALIFALWLEEAILTATTRLFLPRQGWEDRQLFEALRGMLREVGRRDALLNAFTREAGRAFGAGAVRVLLREGEGWREAGSPATPAPGGAADALADAFAAGEPPVGAWEAGRTGLSPPRARAAERLPGLAEAAAGVRARDRIEAVVLLGPRGGGGVYAAAELDRLALLAAQFGIALENDSLYAAVDHERTFNANLLRRLPCGVALFDADGRALLLNEEARRILPPLPGAPDTLLPVIAETLREGHLDGRDLHLPGGADGEDRVVHLRAVRAATGVGRTDGVLLVLNDLTRVRRLEEEVRRREEEAALGIMAAQTAHEIKNPLVTLNTFADLLPTHFDDPDFRDNFAPLVSREVGRINHTVQLLLQYSRPVEPRPEPLRLHPLLRGALDTAARRETGRPTRFVPELEAADDRVRADPRLLGLAVDNLLANAVEAAEGAPLTVTARTRNLRSAEGDLLCLEIEDDGPGMDEKRLGEVFKPFFTTKPAGSGLGLPQARRIIVAHGGRISLDSTPGRGVRVRIHLPAAGDGGGPA